MKKRLFTLLLAVTFLGCSDDSDDFADTSREGEKSSLTVKLLYYDDTTPQNVSFHVIEKASSPNNREWNQAGSDKFFIEDAKLHYQYEVTIKCNKRTLGGTVLYTLKRKNDTWEVWF